MRHPHSSYSSTYRLGNPFSNLTPGIGPGLSDMVDPSRMGNRRRTEQRFDQITHMDKLEQALRPAWDRQNTARCQQETEEQVTIPRTVYRRCAQHHDFQFVGGIEAEAFASEFASAVGGNRPWHIAQTDGLPIVGRTGRSQRTEIDQTEGSWLCGKDGLEESARSLSVHLVIFSFRSCPCCRSQVKDRIDAAHRASECGLIVQSACNPLHT